MRYATKVEIGQVKERQGGVNEDSVSALLFDKTHRDSDRQSVGAFVLADGAGGHDAGDVASYVATSVVPDELSGLVTRLARSQNPILGDLNIPTGETPDKPSLEEIESAIKGSIATADEHLRDMDSVDDAKTTIVVGVYAHGKLHLGWVGDSRAYVINTTQEKIEPITRDHSVVEHYIQENSLSPVVARVHDENNIITRAVGGSTVEVETNSVPIYGDDVVLFTSDGLIDAYNRDDQLYKKYLRERDDEEAVKQEIRNKIVTDDEIAERILDAETLEVAAEKLVRLGVQRGGSDNQSILLFADPQQRTTVEEEVTSLDREYGRSSGENLDLESGKTIVDD